MVNGESAAFRRDLGLVVRSETVAGLGDADLLARFADRHGDAAGVAFEAILVRHGPMVLRICRQILRDTHDVDDAFQETFLVLIRKAGSIRVGDSLGPWLFGVAWKVATKSRAVANKRRALEASTAHVEAVATDETGAVDVRTDLLDELSRLPEKYRSPVVLCHLEDLTHEEAARQLRCPVGTLSSRLSRGLVLLRSRLRRRGLGVPSIGLAPALGLRPMMAVPASLLRSTASIAVGGTVPTTIQHLAKGVLVSMIIGKLKLAGVAILAVATLSVGAASVAGKFADVKTQVEAAVRVEPTHGPPPPPEDLVVGETEVALAQIDTKPSRKDSVVAPALTDIIIDGNLKDWPAAIPRYSISKLLAVDPFFDRLGFGGLENADLSTSPDLSASFSVGYAPKAQLIYLAVIVRDDEVVVGHSSHLDTDSVEVFVDGLLGDRRLPFSGDEDFAKLKLPEFPVQQYVAIPGPGKIYGKPQETNPILMGGDLEKTRTRMAYRRAGHVMTYEWAIQVFDRYPDKPTKLEPGKRIGFDLAIADKDVPAVSPGGFDEPKDDRTAWVYWGGRWQGNKLMDAGGLGEMIIGK